MKSKKLRLLADYHTHTLYSRNNHGKSTIEENVEEAINMGLKEIFITDHGPGHLFYGIERNKLKEIRKTIDELNEKYKGKIKVKMGVEANVVDYNGEIDLKPEEIEVFDIINVGYHNGVKFKNIKSFWNYFIMNFLAKFSSKIRKNIISKNTDAMIKIVEKYPIFMITHPSDKIEMDIEKLAKACAKKGTYLEINSSHGHLSVEELNIAKKTGCKFTVGSDAHRASRVGKVEDSLNRIKEANLDIDDVVNVDFG